MNRAVPGILLLLCLIMVSCGPRLHVRHPVAPGDTYFSWVTWYGDEFKGKKTAAGEPYDPLSFTCAADGFPFGTLLEVRDLDGGGAVVVRVTDRPGKNVIDLTPKAFRMLSAEQAGRLRGRVTVVGLPGENSLLRRNETVASQNFFTVQIGAYSTLENARAFIDSLGIAEAYIYLEQGDRSLYRVRAGRFADRESAENFQKERMKGHGSVVVEVSE
ncbi:MAG TPA: SPOR domain-containing protein [bacterium]|nr:SPOR domain-containing protein [bacterium]